MHTRQIDEGLPAGFVDYSQDASLEEGVTVSLSDAYTAELNELTDRIQTSEGVEQARKRCNLTQMQNWSGDGLRTRYPYLR